MGELAQEDASRVRDSFIEYFQKSKSGVRENFEEMDFENADKRTQMEQNIINMEMKYDSLINELRNMSFE